MSICVRDSNGGIFATATAMHMANDDSAHYEMNKSYLKKKNIIHIHCASIALNMWHIVLTENSWLECE